MILHDKIVCGGGVCRVTAQVASFAAHGGVREWHAVLHVDGGERTFADQAASLRRAFETLREGFAGAECLMCRLFLSDAAAQQRAAAAIFADVPLSMIQQPPLDGSKIAVWIYLQKGSKVANTGGMIVAEHNGYRHLWKMGMHEHKGDSAWQTESLLINYEEILENFGATLAGNCIRTWFFVRDVDTQYAGMVKARKENFREQGLTEQTHFISSTGIGGSPADTRALVQMGTYALTGFVPAQQRYLYAPTHLNPTYEYGVTFERGTVMEYGDRAHVFISGTASINNKGEVVHVGDIVKQTERMWENVSTLLEEGGAAFDDVMQIIVYLRDICDYPVVKAMFDRKFPDTPHVITLAPVCRPTWLIEMECIAVTERRNADFRDF